MVSGAGESRTQAKADPGTEACASTEGLGDGTSGRRDRRVQRRHVLQCREQVRRLLRSRWREDVVRCGSRTGPEADRAGAKAGADHGTEDGRRTAGCPNDQDCTDSGCTRRCNGAVQRRHVFGERAPQRNLLESQGCQAVAERHSAAGVIDGFS